jgi:prepilin-type N-terminal cleavage/methylation domain-containing protein
MAKIHNNRAFTIVEILVVVSIIAMLAGFLIVALSGSQDATKAAKANVKLKEIGMWMQLWSGDNNNRVLPSQFDFQDEVDAGASITYRNLPGVRLVNDSPYLQDDDDNPFDDIERDAYQGTWTDILWTDNNLVNKLGFQSFDFDRQEDVFPIYGDDDALVGIWENDSPDVYPEDTLIYRLYSDFDHPFRSTFMNTRGDARGLPGFYAANDFFDSRSEADINVDTNNDGNISTVDRYYTYAMMNSPSRSIYLVDSIAGETISSEPEPWVAIVNTGSGPVSNDDVPSGDIDFRNGDQCLFLLLDGSIVRLSPWTERGPDTSGITTEHSLLGRGYRVHQLTKRKPSQ